MNQHLLSLIAGGALVVCNHSGGKDSQAMYLKLRDEVPADQLVCIHSHLDGVEWEGVEKHIRATITSPLIITRAGKTFMEMVERRGMWPSSSTRQCTSDLKRGPIKKSILQLLRERRKGESLEPQVIINCMGLRAEESSNRAKMPEFEFQPENSTHGNRKQPKREWYEWLPIHDWSEEEVFASIKAHGQEPHWAYAAGMSRLSCVFCIYSSDHDVQTAARLNPEAYQRYSDLEHKIGHTLIMPSKKKGKRFLSDIVAQAPAKPGEPENHLIEDICILPQPKETNLELLRLKAKAAEGRIRILKLRAQASRAQKTATV